MKQTLRKLLSGILAVSLLLQPAMPTVVFAAEPTTRNVVGFSTLEQREYTLPVGASEVVVNELLATFPETITATVEQGVTEAGETPADNNAAV